MAASKSAQDRVVLALQAKEQGALVVHRRIGEITFQRPAQIRGCLVISAQLAESHAATLVGLGVMGVEPQDVGVVRNRLVVVPAGRGGRGHRTDSSARHTGSDGSPRSNWRSPARSWPGPHRPLRSRDRPRRAADCSRKASLKFTMAALCSPASRERLASRVIDFRVGGVNFQGRRVVVDGVSGVAHQPMNLPALEIGQGVCRIVAQGRA